MGNYQIEWRTNTEDHKWYISALHARLDWHLGASIYPTRCAEAELSRKYVACCEGRVLTYSDGARRLWWCDPWLFNNTFRFRVVRESEANVPGRGSLWLLPLERHCLSDGNENRAFFALECKYKFIFGGKIYGGKA